MRTLSKLALVISALLLARRLPAADPGTATPAKPNIVVILADDMGYGDAGFQGCTDIPTPNLDALARAGVRFSNGYVTAPLCSPSRAAFLTGRHQCRFGHTFNPTRKSPATMSGLDLAQRTIADRLRAAGYVTGLLGKWHQGEAERFHPLHRGFDEFFGFLGGAHSYFEANDETWGPMERNRQPAPLQGYLTDVLATEAEGFIERHRDQPFFLYLAFNAVHVPLQAPKEAVARFAGISDPTRRTYAAMTWKMDAAVGRVQQKLRELKLTEKTLVFFWSDNGGPVKNGGTAHGVNGSSNRPLRGGKTQLLEGGIREPFLVSWPGVLPAGKVEDRPIVQLDVLPTALAAAGVAADPAWRLDGANLLPFLTGKDAGLPHQRLFWKYGRNQFAIREGAWKLVYWKDEAGVDPFTQAELYNLSEDIGESRDQASTQPEKVRELLAAWRAWDRDNPGPNQRSKPSSNPSVKP